MAVYDAIQTVAEGDNNCFLVWVSLYQQMGICIELITVCDSMEVIVKEGLPSQDDLMLIALSGEKLCEVSILVMFAKKSWQ